MKVELKYTMNKLKLRVGAKIMRYLIILMLWFPGVVMAEDLLGNALPSTIPQGVHDVVVEAGGLEDAPVDGNHPYYHWLSSGHTIEVLDDFYVGYVSYLEGLLLAVDEQRLLCEQELASGDDDIPGCVEVSDFVDGAGGALWKPVSDNTGNPVILYPKELTGQLNRSSCEIFASNGDRLLGCPYRTTANGGREHYDVEFPASVLVAEAPLVVRILRTDGLFDCRRVDIPTRRYD